MAIVTVNFMDRKSIYRELDYYLVNLLNHRAVNILLLSKCFLIGTPFAFHDLLIMTTTDIFLPDV
ncbi:hypothetical protein ACJX0J_038625, partial [Zea mays]